MERTVLHIVDGSTQTRAQLARMGFALGHHVEVYADLNELLDRPPREGVLLVSDVGSLGSARQLIDQLAERGVALAVVMTATEVELERVVYAVRAGALDYLVLPLDVTSFARRLSRIITNFKPYAERRRRELEGVMRIQTLTSREREVLALLSGGLANADIAKRLGISRRTVEVHRGNMMTKLGANHVAGAVRMWIAAGLEASAGAELGEANDTSLPQARTTRE